MIGVSGFQISSAPKTMKAKIRIQGVETKLKENPRQFDLTWHVLTKLNIQKSF